MAALALGESMGLHRAASWLALGWAALVVTPSLLASTLPVLLEPVSMPMWAGATAAVAIVLVVRRHTYTDLGSTR